MKQEIIRIDLGAVNCYLGKMECGFILFDTGGHMVMDKEFTNRCDILLQELDKAGCHPGNLNLIVLTHGDNDHVCNAAYIRNKYNAKIAIHPKDCKLVENPSIDNFMSSFNYRSLMYKMVFRIMRKTIYNISLKTLNDFEKFIPDILIDDHFDLSEYGFEGKILYMPGHTAGSIGILTTNGELIAGDIFANIGKPSSALNAIDFKLLAESVSKLNPYDVRIIYPGHGMPFQFGDLSYR